MAENTFLGLQPYTEADAYRFKGRTEESQELFRLIVRNDYTVCYAESGEGKTSLLNAGVFPLLRQNMFFPIAITFTSDDYQHTPDSFDTIIDRCIKDSIAEYNEKNKSINIEYKLCSTDFQDTDCQSALQQELSKYSWWKLRNYKPQVMGLTFTPVFVFDQFEEVFNLPGSIVWTKKFFDWLEDVSSDSCPDDIIQKIRMIIGEKATFPAIKEENDFKAVFSLRKEFIGELDYWGMQKCFIPSLKDNRYCLKALTYEGAKKVMTQQQRFEDTKVEQVLRYFVQQYSREPEKTIAENLPVIPALLLSVVCDSWEKDINYFSDIDANGIDDSLNKILEEFYDEALSAIVDDLSQKEVNSQTEQIRNDIETAIFALVDSNGKRVRRKSSELSHLNFDAKYKEILSANRIIKISKIDGEDYVEIVHDSPCPIIAKRKEGKRLEKEREKAAEKQRLLEISRKKNRIYINVFCIIASIIFLVLTIITTWSSSTGIKGCLASIDHQGIWTYAELEKFKYLPLSDSLIIDDKDLYGGMTLRNNLAIKKVHYNLDSIGLTVKKCENLQEIVLGDDVVKANIDIDASSKNLRCIHIGEKVSQLYINIDAEQMDSLVFDVSPQNNYYKWDYCFANEKSVEENAGIGFLWDKRDGSIVYMLLREDYKVPTQMQFPDDFIKICDCSNIQYESNTFTNVPVDIQQSHAYSRSRIEKYALKEIEKTIGLGAFSGCINLKSIIGYPEEIEMFAFSGCEKLERINLDSVGSIGTFAFYNCHSLKEINLSCNYDSDKTDFVNLDAGVFKDCWNLKSVRFPKVLLLSPLYHWLRTFENCLQLEELYLPDTIKVYDYIQNIWSEDNINCVSTLFSNCPNISKIHISPHSLFRMDSASRIVYYKDIPVISNLADNFNWMNNDSLHYQRDGILYTTIDDHIVHIPSRSIGNYPNWKRYLGTDYYNSGDTLIYMFPDSTESSVYLPYVGKYQQCVGFSFPFSINVKEIHTPYAEPRMWANGATDPNVINNWSDIILYVPWGTKQAYEKDYRFRGFKEIREDSFGWRMYMSLHYAFNKLLSKPWKFIVYVIMILPIFSMARKRIKKEKEKYNYRLKYRDALFASFCVLFVSLSAYFLLIWFIDYHLISLF